MPKWPRIHPTRDWVWEVWEPGPGLALPWPGLAWPGPGWELGTWGKVVVGLMDCGSGRKCLSVGPRASISLPTQPRVPSRHSAHALPIPNTDANAHGHGMHMG